MRATRREFIVAAATAQGFEGLPLVAWLDGMGRVVEPCVGGWCEPITRFPDYHGACSVNVVDAERVADSCGFAVPLYEFKGERSQRVDHAEDKGPQGIEAYRAARNRRSIDGLAGLRSAAEPDP